MNVDEGLVKILKGRARHAESLALAIQKYLKSEGYVKLPGKYVVKKGCLVKID